MEAIGVEIGKSFLRYFCILMISNVVGVLISENKKEAVSERLLSVKSLMVAVMVALVIAIISTFV